MEKACEQFWALLEYVPALDTNVYLIRGDKGAEYRKCADYRRCRQVLQVYPRMMMIHQYTV
jgi:hypothetical protein